MMTLVNKQNLSPSASFAHSRAGVIKPVGFLLNQYIGRTKQVFVSTMPVDSFSCCNAGMADDSRYDCDRNSLAEQFRNEVMAQGVAAEGWNVSSLCSPPGKTI